MFSKYLYAHGCLGTHSLYGRDDCLKFEGGSSKGHQTGWGWGAARNVWTPSFVSAPPSFWDSGCWWVQWSGPIGLSSIWSCRCIFSALCLFCHRVAFKRSKINVQTSLLNSFISYSIPWPFSTFLKEKIQCNVASLCLLSFVGGNKALSTVAIAHNYTAFNGSVLAHIEVQRSL